ncbi:urease accessory protein UreJ [Vibrio sp. UCD-FRSSP16_10]|uniref:HupE/UreJ family protein n=1 Tax=unclassified Vibrio TaxID=2614977 RepID=UPI00080104E0|nr:MULTISPECIES: HupE/UreJ family protein [unclassified Vibrio]OBT10124.1 urease accessory protein UreJ [Vibrio sp. UCD-FRSSP16_30]OBT18914.1 urease accessory protein UreJ [Vibrio sp. UCD-FRSSP16_10]
MKTKFIALLALLITPTLALAHPGHDHHSFSAGITHPITGMDHLIMLFAFGLLVGCTAVANRKKSGLIIAGMISLVSGLFVGEIIGFSMIVEPAIIASLLIVSISLWHVFSPLTARVAIAVSASIGMLFFHGYAHGVEATGNVSLFASGMFISALMLMTLGCVVGYFFRSKWLSVGVASVSALLIIAA